MRNQNVRQSKPNPIGIFDSGIGGLTVIRQLLRHLPGESLVYFGDTARVPYGTKSDRAVREFAWENSLFLLGHQVKMIVVACNTASAVALGELNRYLKIPVIGVIQPGAKAAVNVTQTGRVGVIGTQATVESKSYDREIHALNPEIEVFATSCPLFVPLAEEGWTEGEVPEQIAVKYLTPLIESQIDTLILGCTHYPLLKPLLAKVLGKGITLVDSAEETALEVSAVLDQQGLVNTGGEVNNRYFVSDFPRKFESLGERFLGQALGIINIAEPWKHINPQVESGT